MIASLRALIALFLIILFSKAAAQSLSVPEVSRRRQAGTTLSQDIKRLKYRTKVYQYIIDIYMKDGSVLAANSIIFLDSTTKSYYIYYTGEEETRKIVPSETIKVGVRRSDLIGSVDFGTASDSCWTFTIATGKISAYSRRKPTNVEFLKFDNGDLIPFKPEILKPYLEALPKAMNAFREKDYLKAIRIYNKANE